MATAALVVLWLAAAAMTALMGMDRVPWQMHYLAFGAVWLGVAALVPVVLARALEQAGRRLYLFLAALAPALYYMVGRPWGDRGGACRNALSPLPRVLGPGR